MTLLHKLIVYLWPIAPATISDESKDAKAKGSFDVLDDSNRMRVDVWTRHRDNLACAENANTYAAMPSNLQHAGPTSALSHGAWRCWRKTTWRLKFH